MKITQDNYINAIEKVGLENLPEEIRQAHLYIMKMTDEGKDWSLLQTNSNFRRIAELTFKKLEEFSAGNPLDGKNGPLYIHQAKEDAKNYKSMDTDQLKSIYKLQIMDENEYDEVPLEAEIRNTALEKELKKRDPKWLKETQEHFSINREKKEKNYDPLLEIQMIERFLAFRDKLVQKNTIRMFVEDLQNAIREKKIRKKSPYAKQIERLQEAAILFYNKSGKINRMVLSEELSNELYSAIIDYENKIGGDEKNDPIKPVELSGTEKPQGEIMSSLEFTQKEFSCLGFDGKWLNLIGDPSAGFTAMVFGRPKMGKSFFCVDFAGYLARNFGKVLYVAKEEKLDRTLQEKLKQKDVAHVNLTVSDHLPEDLSGYDFIFLDSVNLLGLSPADLRKLKEKNPGKSFIYVFQTTKSGNFRGANSFQHDVDVVIEIPEKGKAVQYGRFNQGGDMNIFEDAVHVTEELSGTLKKVNVKYPDWTKPKHLDKEDHDDLKHIYLLYTNKKYKAALDYGSILDTIVREEIPPEIWKAIGGELTPSGEERLPSKSKSKSFDPEEYSDCKDEENPAFIFSLTGTGLLVQALKKEFDIMYLVRRELANRGQDENGQWVGFEKAKKIHKV